MRANDFRPAGPGVEASIRVPASDFRDLLSLVRRDYGFESFLPVGQLVRFRESHRGRLTGRWFIVETRPGEGGAAVMVGWPPVCCSAGVEPAALRGG